MKRPGRATGTQETAAASRSLGGQSTRTADTPWRRRRALVWESARFGAYLRRIYGTQFAWYVHDPDAPPWGDCDGAHHPGLGCDYWGPCSGAAYTYPQHRALRGEEAIAA